MNRISTFIPTCSINCSNRSETSAQTLIATHSIDEASPDEVIVIDKSKKKADRVSDLSSLQQAISVIGSAQNVHLSRLARGKKVLFFEGQDFKIVRRLAATCGYKGLADTTDLVVLQVGGFSQWRKVEDAAWTFQKLLDINIRIGALFDRDYLSEEQISDFLKSIRKTVPATFVLGRKEIENYLLHPAVLSRAVEKRLNETGRNGKLGEKAATTLLNKVANQFKSLVVGQISSERAKFTRGKIDPSVAIKEGAEIVDSAWGDLDGRIRLAPGKQVLSKLNHNLQTRFGVSVSGLNLASNIRRSEIPDDLNEIFKSFDKLSG